jgi:hypothetical protein
MASFSVMGRNLTHDMPHAPVPPVYKIQTKYMKEELVKKITELKGKGRLMEHIFNAFSTDERGYFILFYPM